LNACQTLMVDEGECSESEQERSQAHDKFGNGPFWPAIARFVVLAKRPSTRSRTPETSNPTHPRQSPVSIIAMTNLTAQKPTPPRKSASKQQRAQSDADGLRSDDPLMVERFEYTGHGEEQERREQKYVPIVIEIT
jgi:hypothetical protein